MIDRELNEVPSEARSSVCGTCGESLVGEVNVCWKCGERVVPQFEEKQGSPFGPGASPRAIPSSHRGVDAAIESATATAACLIGVLCLPFAHWMPVTVVPATIGAALAVWALSSGQCNRRAILAILICSVSLWWAGPEAMQLFSYWYQDMFGGTAF